MDDTTNATDDPAGKVSIRVKRITPAPTIAATITPAVQVSGDMVHQGQDVGDASLYISGPAGSLLELGQAYQLVRVQ